jgi:competence protein ComEC
VLAAFLFHDMPPLWLMAAFAIISLAALLHPRTRPAALFALAACWALWHCANRLEDRLIPELDGVTLSVCGLIAGLPEEYPEYLRFRFKPEKCEGREELPGILLVYWYRDWPELDAGERWRLQLRLRPPRSRVNFQGGDRERWLFANGIGGLATVQQGDNRRLAPSAGFPLQGLREKIRERISRLVENERARGVILAIAIADRSGLATEDRTVLTVTGTGHLLAISGLHVGLAAIAGFWLARLLLLLFPTVMVGGRNLGLAWIGSLLAALAYTALAGFGISTQRAMLMLLIAVAVLASRRNVHPGMAWLLALAAVLLVNPLAPLNAGFWFSFTAVAVLLLLFVPRPGGVKRARSMVLAQLGIGCCLAPLTLYWFQVLAPLGFVANLIAIPWVSFLVVPLTLLAVLLLPFSDSVAGLVFTVAALASSGLLSVLDFLGSRHGLAPVLAAPGLAAALLAFLGGLLLLLPGGFPHRWLGLLLLLPLILPKSTGIRQDELLVEVLDVGQGLAVLVSTRGHTLLYDSGPGDGRNWSLVRAVIAPSLAGAGSPAPDRIIISHGDLDHAGGLHHLQRRYPDSGIHANLAQPQAGLPACTDLLDWHWDGVDFQVLHPSPHLPYLGNDSSCVLSIKAPSGSVLLTGDISETVEARLVNAGVAPHTLMLVPHHGSATSSGQSFLERLSPAFSVASTAKGNRFGFPKPEVLRRYHRSATEFWSTGDCGALRVYLPADGTASVESARKKRQRIWRWPAEEGCP